MTNATNPSPDKFVRGHRRAASEWSAASTTSYHSSEPLKKEENSEIRVVIFVDVETEYLWFKNLFIEGKNCSFSII